MIVRRSMGFLISAIACSVLTAVLSLAGVSQASAEIRILAYGDSNTWGWRPVDIGFQTTRFADSERWAGVLETALEARLGEPTKVIVDGLVGRTTDVDRDQIGSLTADDFNGAESLPERLAQSNPLNLVVIMLGTNDLQQAIQRQPTDIAGALLRMSELARASNQALYSVYPAPEVVLVAPPALGDTSRTPLGSLFAAGEKPSTMLGPAICDAAEEMAVPCFDAGTATSTDGVDGVHLTLENHQELGEALAVYIADLLD